MKNSKEHAQRLRRLYRDLKRASPGVERTIYEDPAEALVCGIISERRSESATQRALKEIGKAFVDWNDLRVAHVEEVAEALGGNSASCRATALALTTVLRGIFDEHHRISLQTLKKLGKRPARQGLEKLGGVSRFVINYCLLTALEAHAIPMTGDMVEYLKRHEIIEADADEEDIEGFLVRHVAAKDAYEFYTLLRRESESSRGAKKKTKGQTPVRGPHNGRAGKT
jgi:endonuclease III